MKRKLAAALLTSVLLLSQLLAGEPSPAVKFAVAPKYPALTLAGRVYGAVLVRVTIDQAGAVVEAQVTDGHPMLRQAALNAAGQWRFKESSSGKRITTLKFNFVILPENSDVKSQTIFLPPNGFEIRQKPEQPSMEDEGGEPGPDPQPISRA